MPVSDSSTSLLLKAATPDLYRRNAFRLTGLPVTASAREVARQADKLKMLADLGGQAAQQLSVIPGMEPPSAEEIREATQRLKDVEARALDEFFWFWPEDWEKPEADEAFAAIKRHDLDTAFSIWAEREVQTESLKSDFIASRNIALVLHMRAIEWVLLDLSHPVDKDRLEQIHGYWKEALDRWEWLSEDDRLWAAFKTRIRQIDDPALNTGFSRRIRSELRHAFDTISASLCFKYIDNGREEEAEWHVSFLKYLRVNKGQNEDAWDVVLSSTLTEIERAVTSARKRQKSEPTLGFVRAEQLLDSVERLLKRLEVFHIACAWDPTPKRHALFEMDNDIFAFTNYRSHIHEKVIETVLRDSVQCVNAFIAFSKTNNDAHLPLAKRELIESLKLRMKVQAHLDFIKILQRLPRIGIDEELHIRMDENIASAEKNLRQDRYIQPILKRLALIQSDTVGEPSYLIDAITKSVVPLIKNLHEQRILESSELHTVRSAAAITLHSLAVRAYKQESMRVAVRAAELALPYSDDTELRRKIESDLVTLRGLVSKLPPETRAADLSSNGEHRNNTANDEDHVALTLMIFFVLLFLITFFLVGLLSKTPT
jgi:hypothetical protein